MIHSKTTEIRWRGSIKTPHQIAIENNEKLRRAPNPFYSLARAGVSHTEALARFWNEVVEAKYPDKPGVVVVTKKGDGSYFARGDWLTNPDAKSLGPSNSIFDYFQVTIPYARHMAEVLELEEPKQSAEDFPVVVIDESREGNDTLAYWANQSYINQLLWDLETN